MVRRAVPLLGILFGCTPPTLTPTDTTVEVVVINTDTLLTLDSTRVEAFADSTFTVLVRRSAIEGIIGDTGWVSDFYLPEGTYYIRAWKDTDRNGEVSPGDLYGFVCSDSLCTVPKAIRIYDYDHVKITLRVRAR